jgi:hypothetical protein
MTVQRQAVPVSDRRHVQHAEVIKDQQTEGEYAQGVDIVAAGHAEFSGGKCAQAGVLSSHRVASSD